MATYDSADLLVSFNSYAGRPQSDAISDPSKYARLAKAQNRVIALMQGVAPASLYPKVAYGSLPTLTTTDNKVYTFGTDANGFPIYPMGKGGLYTSLNNIPDSPMVENIDYISEGTQIRIPNNGVGPATIYWYGITAPADITAATQPSILPEAARELIVIEAVRRFAQEFLRNTAMVDEMTAEWKTAWPIWCLVWKTQFRDGGAISLFSNLKTTL